MGRGLSLCEYEKGQIQAYQSTGLSQLMIANKMKRSVKVIWSYLKNPSNYGMNYVKGRPQKTTNREKNSFTRRCIAWIKFIGS